MGKVLKVDLSNKKVEIEELKKETLKKYIGGSGLGTKYLYELTGNDTDPLGEENVLIFMTGPLTGTKAFSSDRFQVITKSPLTNIFGEANCGGQWGSALKRSGYDGIVISGKAENPVYISIDNSEVKILDADELWGLDVFETDEKLKAGTAKDTEVACIGPAGENLVRYASISTVGVHARVAARSGCGAVMGSKNLKAIVVSGNQSVEINDPKGLDKFYTENVRDLGKDAVSKFLRDIGTFGALESLVEIGNTPVKNWTEIRLLTICLISYVCAQYS